MQGDRRRPLCVGAAGGDALCATGAGGHVLCAVSAGRCALCVGGCEGGTACAVGARGCALRAGGRGERALYARVSDRRATCTCWKCKRWRLYSMCCVTALILGDAIRTRPFVFPHAPCE